MRASPPIRYLVLCDDEPVTPPRLAELPPRALAALQDVDVTGLGLEIGPSYNPIAPKSAGFDVRILDHDTQDGLVAKYRAAGLSEAELARIEPVDYVWSGGDIVDAVEPDTRFDFIVAAHVIEHTTDVIGLLNSASALLTPTGVLSLIVPDKRFTFDRARPLSTAGQVVEAHLLPRTFHGPAAFIDTHLYSVRNGGDGMVWDRATATRLDLAQCSWAAVRHTVGTVMADEHYHDIHRWVFTPESLELLLGDLYHLGYIDMTVSSLTPTDNYEFFITLRRTTTPSNPNGPVANPDRLRLLTAMEQTNPAFPSASAVERLQARATQVWREWQQRRGR